jgi:hypothetical protein
MRRRHGLNALALGCLGLMTVAASTAPGRAADPQTLQVGVVQNAMPCSDLSNGQALGSAVDL